MLSVAELRNTIRPYAWGSRTALAELCGRPSPSAQPEAELWMGAHPGAPSEVQVDGSWTPLPAWIGQDPEAVLGRSVVARFGAELPFLLKLLAADQPLSIQAHPNRAQAEAGYAREDALGIPIDAPHRNYRDPNPKPELICAITPFEGLLGFRPLAAIRASVEAAGAPLSPLAHAFERGSAEEMLRALLVSWLALPEDAIAAFCAAQVADADPVFSDVHRLAALHPGDSGVLAPIFLNRFRLAPGEALFLPAGRLHAYLRGLGVEIMACSDNVLRGGLTPKHVDVDELQRVLRFEETAVEILQPTATGDGEAHYEAPAEEFALSVLEPGDEGMELRPGSVELLLCLAGDARILTGSGVSKELAAGRSCIVPAAVDSYRVEGRARVARARVPV